jgi:hypothetical protein
MTHVKNIFDFEQFCSKCGGKIKMIVAATSGAFVADLPPLDPEQLSKLYTWGKHACTRFDVHMKGEGLMLAAERKKSGTAREHQRLLRTNLLNWGVELPAKQSGWLRLVPANAQGESEKTGAECNTTAMTASDALKESEQVPGADAPFPNCAMPARGLRLPRNLLTVH